VAKRPGEITATQISRKLEIYSATTGKTPSTATLEWIHTGKLWSNIVDGSV